MDNKKIERKTLIDLGYSKYWSVVYTDGSYKQIPVIKEKETPIEDLEKETLEIYEEFIKNRGTKRT